MKDKIEEISRQIQTATERGASPELIERLKRDKGMMEIMHAQETERVEFNKTLTSLSGYLLRDSK